MAVYYSDDLTDIVNNQSSFHTPGDPIRQADIEASIEEARAAGVDTYVMQPGLCWVPWWKSSVYPAAEHYRWYCQTYKAHLTGLEALVANGADVVQIGLDYCRSRRLRMMVSIRLNDNHGIVFSGQSLDYIQKHIHDPGLPDWQRTYPINLSRIHADHPEWRIEPGSTNFEMLTWDWNNPEAVAHKLALYAELAQNYDIDGMELDFMRAPVFFKPELDSPARIDVMTRFIRAMRAALDAGRRGRELAIRLPPKVDSHASLGLDLARLPQLGVDRINVSNGFFTSQDTDFQQIKSVSGSKNITVELTQAKSFLQLSHARYPGDPMLMLSTPDDDLTTAYLAKRTGFQGVSLFNFTYYREQGRQRNGFDPGHEPPFAVVERLKHPLPASATAQSWFLGTTYSSGYKGQLPARVAPDRPATLTMVILPFRPEDADECVLKAYVRDVKTRETRTAAINAAFNHQDLRQSPSPLPQSPINTDDVGFSTWTLPIRLINSGTNVVNFTVVSGQPCEVMFVNLEFRLKHSPDSHSHG